MENARGRTRIVTLPERRDGDLDKATMGGKGVETRTELHSRTDEIYSLTGTEERRKRNWGEWPRNRGEAAPGGKLTSILNKWGFGCCSPFPGNRQQTFGICLETVQAGAEIVGFDMESWGLKSPWGAQPPLPCLPSATAALSVFLALPLLLHFQSPRRHLAPTFPSCSLTAASASVTHFWPASFQLLSSSCNPPDIVVKEHTSIVHCLSFA